MSQHEVGSKEELIESVLSGFWEEPPEDLHKAEALKMAHARWCRDLEIAKSIGDAETIKRLKAIEPCEWDTREYAKGVLQSIVVDYAARLAVHEDAGSIKRATGDIRKLRMAAVALSGQIGACGAGAQLFLGTACIGQSSPPDAVDMLHSLKGQLEIFEKLLGAGLAEHQGNRGRRDAATVLWGKPELFLMRLCLERLRWCPSKRDKLVAVAGHLHEVATGNAPGDSWGEDASERALVWWKKIEKFRRKPMASWSPMEFQVWGGGPESIPSPKQQRGRKKAQSPST